MGNRGELSGLNKRISTFLEIRFKKGDLNKYHGITTFYQQTENIYFYASPACIRTDERIFTLNKWDASVNYNAIRLLDKN